MINLDNIPSELKQIDNWVLWKYEKVPGRDKPTKVPYQINGHKAKANDSNTWTTFDNVITTFCNAEGMNNSFSGIGFVFSDEHPFIGIDIDDCINDGIISEGAMKIINTFNSYTETSVSGKGVHTIVKIDRNRVVNSKSYEKFFGTDFKECEIAYNNKYFTMTGTVIDDLYTVVDATDTLLGFIPENKQRTDTIKETAAQESTFDKELLSKVVESLGELSKHRRDDYQSWIEVGMSLRSLENVGLALWDNWSKDSSKYTPGECYKKWQTFNTGDGGLTLNSLFYWAEEDSREVVIPEGDKNSTPNDYNRALELLGYDFTLNLMNDGVYLSGVSISDIMMSVIRNRMRMYGYKKDKWIADSINELASKKTYHPIRDYLGSLVWDGQDHIGKLSIYFKDKKNVFHFYFRKWVVGAVARAYAGDQGCQNAMLVLDGKQNLGKSFFASWLCSPLPAYFIESPVFPDDKDYKIRCVSSWIWEVYELGSTTRKADREALKGFITAPTVTVRKPYGHCDIKKPATTNFIGTLNNEGGFLNDPTGSRRFLVSTLEEIDWRYSKEVDVNQLWAQAVALYRSGEKWELNGKERETQEEINEEYRVYNPLIDCIRRAFIIDPHKGYFTPSSEIMETLYKNNYIQRMDKSESMKVAEALIELGCVQERRRVGGALVRGWSGLQAKDNVSVGDRYGLIDEDRSYN